MLLGLAVSVHLS